MKRTSIYLLLLVIANQLFASSFSFLEVDQLPSIQSMLITIRQMYENEKYNDVISYVNSNLNRIEKEGGESKESFLQYKSASQIAIINSTASFFAEGQYNNALSEITPIIEEITDSIVNTVVCNEKTFLWCAGIIQYGVINSRLNNLNEAIKALSISHNYVSNNLYELIELTGGSFSKMHYANSWLELVNAYINAGMYDYCVESSIALLDYCKNDYQDFLFDAFMGVGLSYQTSNNTDDIITSNKYFRDALLFLKENNLIGSRQEDYYLVLREIVNNYAGLLKYYQGVLDTVDEFFLTDLHQSEIDGIDDIVITILGNVVASYFGLSFSPIGSLEKTTKIIEELLNYYDKRNEKVTNNYLYFLRLLAECYSKKDKMLADSCYEDALKLWDGISNKEDKVEYYNLLGSYLVFLQSQRLSDFKTHEMERTIEQAIYEHIVDDMFTINYYQNRSRFYIYYSSPLDYLRANSLIDTAISLYKKNDVRLNEVELYLTLLSDKSNIELLLGNYSEADKYANETLNTLKNVNNYNLNMSDALKSISNNYLVIGDKLKADSLMKVALDIQVKCGLLYSTDGDIELPLMSELIQYSNPDEQLLYCKDVIDEVKNKKIKYSYWLSRIYTQYASANSILGNFSIADSLFHKTEIDIKGHKEDFYNNEYSLALENFYANYSTHEAYKGNLVKAAFFEELSNKEYSNYTKDQWLSTLYAYLGNEAQFEKHIVKALDGIRSNLKESFVFLSEYERQKYVENRTDLNLYQYGEYAALMPQSIIGLQNVYNAALIYKGVLLNTEKEIRKAINESEVDTDIKDLYQEVMYLKGANKDSEELKAKEKQILYYLQNNITFKDLELTWNSIRDNLKDNECAIEFLKFRKNQWVWCNDEDQGFHYLALVITKDSDSPTFVDLFDESVLEDAVRQGARLYSNNSAKDFARLLWGKIFGVVGDSFDVVYFSPIGLLNQLNVESLLEDGKSYIRLSSTREVCKDNVDVIESVALYGGLIYDGNEDVLDSYLKTDLLPDTLKQSSINNTITRGSFYFLPGTYDEVIRIQNLLSRANMRVSAKTGLSGDVDSFRSLSGESPSIIHIATHAIWNENSDKKESLKNGGLLFSSSINEDKVPVMERHNFIYAQEISTMDFSNTSLAVLSACQTGIGHITDDGVWGIQRGFKMAGVQTILMSLWQVDDAATALLMSTFYQELLQTGSKHEAFKLAQKELKEKFEDPYYWAGFIMMD